MNYRSVFRPGLFAGQVIVVTGGGSGIGRCTAHELAALGAHVVLVGRTLDKLEAVATEIREDGGEASCSRLRHPRRGGGEGRGDRHPRRARPHPRPGQQRGRPVPGPARWHLGQRLAGGDRQQPHRRLPDGARVLHAVHAHARRRDRQHAGRHVARHAGHGPQRRGARRHAQLHRDRGLRMGRRCGSTPWRRAGSPRAAWTPTRPR